MVETCKCAEVLSNLESAREEWNRLLRVDKASIREYHNALKDYADLFWHVKMYENQWVPDLGKGDNHD